MDIIGISYLGIVLATVASYFAGFLWHGPLFGRQWVKMMGYTPETMQTMQLTGRQAMIGGFIAQFVQVFFLAQILMASRALDLISALMITLFLWIGFIALTQFATVLWENRSVKLFLFNAAYQLVQVSISAAVLVLVGIS